MGYRISGDVVESSRTVLSFVTTGYLLQMLISNPSTLTRFSHLILDEVHERSVDADLLSLVVRLQTMVARETPIKIIVMSATLQVTYNSTHRWPQVPIGGALPISSIHIMHISITQSTAISND